MSIKFPCDVCTMRDTLRCARYKECHLWLNWAKKAGVSPEVKPQAPNQADDATVQPPAVDSVGYLETHFEKVGHQLYRRCEPDEECIIEVYVLNVDRCVVRYQRLLGEVIWSEYTTAHTLKAYLKVLFAQECLGSLEE